MPALAFLSAGRVDAVAGHAHDVLAFLQVDDEELALGKDLRESVRVLDGLT